MRKAPKDGRRRGAAAKLTVSLALDAGASHPQDALAVQLLRAGDEIRRGRLPPARDWERVAAALGALGDALVGVAAATRATLQLAQFADRIQRADRSSVKSAIATAIKESKARGDVPTFERVRRALQRLRADRKRTKRATK